MEADGRLWPAALGDEVVRLVKVLAPWPAQGSDLVATYWGARKACWLDDDIALLRTAGEIFASANRRGA
jgi:hypothetical protein